VAHYKRGGIVERKGRVLAERVYFAGMVACFVVLAAVIELLAR
jgi:hypothetical protein